MERTGHYSQSFFFFKKPGKLNKTNVPPHIAIYPEEHLRSADGKLSGEGAREINPFTVVWGMQLGLSSIVVHLIFVQVPI